MVQRRGVLRKIGVLLEHQRRRKQTAAVQYAFFGKQNHAVVRRVGPGYVNDSNASAQKSGRVIEDAVGAFERQRAPRIETIRHFPLHAIPVASQQRFRAAMRDNLNTLAAKCRQTAGAMQRKAGQNDAAEIRVGIRRRFPDHLARAFVGPGSIKKVDAFRVRVKHLIGFPVVVIFDQKEMTTQLRNFQWQIVPIHRHGIVANPGTQAEHAAGEYRECAQNPREYKCTATPVHNAQIPRRCLPRIRNFSQRLNDFRAVLILLTLPAFACDRNALEEFRLGPLQFRGAAVAHVHRRGLGYGSGRTTEELYPHLKKLGYDSIQLNTFAYQPEIQSTDLSWDDPTLTEADLTLEIRAAHAAGFSVLLKPHVWVGGYDSASVGQWRSGIDFSNDRELDRWFARYTRFIVPQARLAEREGVAAFAIGTELVRLTHAKNDRRWRDLIREVRAVYSGRITYACEAWNAKNIRFWDQLDAIGLDFYYGPPGPEPATGELAEFYRGKLAQHLRHARELRRPLWLTEIGFPSHPLAIETPHAWPRPEYAVDLARQTKAYEALRQALHDLKNDPQNTGDYPAGIWIWKYTTSLDGYEQQQYARGFNMRGKPAEDIIRRIFDEAPRPIQ